MIDTLSSLRRFACGRLPSYLHPQHNYWEVLRVDQGLFLTPTMWKRSGMNFAVKRAKSAGNVSFFARSPVAPRTTIVRTSLESCIPGITTAGAETEDRVIVMKRTNQNDQMSEPALLAEGWRPGGAGRGSMAARDVHAWRSAAMSFSMRSRVELYMLRALIKFCM